jgi:hypothetical protein
MDDVHVLLPGRGCRIGFRVECLGFRLLPGRRCRIGIFLWSNVYTEWNMRGGVVELDDVLEEVRACKLYCHELLWTWIESSES